MRRSRSQRAESQRAESPRAESPRRFAAYWNALPPQRQGVLIGGLLANAVVTILLYAFVGGRLAMLARRTWRRHTGAAAGRRGLDQRDLAVVVVLIFHTLIRRRLAAGLRRRVAEHTSVSLPTGPGSPPTRD